MISRLVGILLLWPSAVVSREPQHALVGTGRSATSEHAIRIDDVTSGLENYTAGLMQRWHVPGLAVAIVQENDTWAKGFGYASLPSTPVTPETLFYTGSTTKSFTAAAMSLMVDNSSDYLPVNWTTPISHILRDEFVLSQDWATEHITIEDALSHRTGYPRHDMTFPKTIQQLVHHLRYLPMSAEPRTKFQYSNHMFNSIGYLISTLSGLSLGEFFHTYLWNPMGMNTTFLGTHDPQYKVSGLTVADSYWYKNDTGEYIKQPLTDETADEGAGATISNVLDYAKYLRIMIAESGPISKNGHRELKNARSFWHRGPPFVGPTTYSLGWASSIFQNHQAWFHAGQVNAYRSEMLMIPSKKIGIVVMSTSHTDACALVLYRILYDLFDVKPAERFDHEAASERSKESELNNLRTCSQRLFPDLPTPPLPHTRDLANHVGHYHDLAYGTLSVYLKCKGDGQSACVVSYEQGDTCHLRVELQQDPLGNYYMDLHHKSGDYWLGWAHMRSTEEPERPLLCVRAQFRVDQAGQVSQFGLDLRLEGEDGPLVWFNRAIPQ